MYQEKGQTIKLFGKRILLQENANIRDCNKEENEEPKEDKYVESGNEDVTSYYNSDESNDHERSTDYPETPNTKKEHKIPENDDQSETNDSQEETLKKPDKIIPCPRCNSMDTKFCYYNNYNVSQPRYFCKKCQRYWTEGGSMRNVPVGSGRRKSKASFGPHYRHVKVSKDDVTNVLRQNNSKKDQNSSIIESLGSKKTGSGNRVDPKFVENGVGLSTHWACYPWYPMPQPTNSTFVPSNFPVTFYPPQAYWGYTLPVNWNVVPNNNSPALEKRPIEDDNLEKNDKRKSFRSKYDEENQRDERSLVLQANPAALSRSLNFHENVY